MATTTTTRPRYLDCPFCNATGRHGCLSCESKPITPAPTSSKPTASKPAQPEMGTPESADTETPTPAADTADTTELATTRTEEEPASDKPATISSADESDETEDGAPPASDESAETPAPTNEAATTDDPSPDTVEEDVLVELPYGPYFEKLVHHASRQTLENAIARMLPNASIHHDKLSYAIRTALERTFISATSSEFVFRIFVLWKTTTADPLFPKVLNEASIKELEQARRLSAKDHERHKLIGDELVKRTLQQPNAA